MLAISVFRYPFRFFRKYRNLSTSLTSPSMKDCHKSTVFAIDQDKRGNMWFATYDGVNKYDGYAFTVYQHNEDDPNSIANDISRIVKTDSQGRV